MKNVVLPLAVSALILTAAFTYANNDQSRSSGHNPLQGKVVVLNPSGFSTPHANARIEDLGGRKYVVYAVTPEDPEKGGAYDFWTAIDEIDYMHVFQNMKEAKSYLERLKGR